MRTGQRSDRFVSTRDSRIVRSPDCAEPELCGARIVRSPDCAEPGLCGPHRILIWEREDRKAHNHPDLDPVDAMDAPKSPPSPPPPTVQELFGDPDQDLEELRIQGNAHLRASADLSELGQDEDAKREFERGTMLLYAVLVLSRNDNRK